jgi:hypothetical protein
MTAMLRTFVITMAGSTEEPDPRHLNYALQRFAQKHMRTLGFPVDDASVELSASNAEKYDIGPESAAELNIDFASDSAAELAAVEGLLAEAFDGFTPSGVRGFTVSDVRNVMSAAV